jgi:hypothetical protein
MTDKDELLQRGLEALEKGADPEIIRAGLTQESDELASLVQLAAAVRNLPHPEPMPVCSLARKQALVHEAERKSLPAPTSSPTRPRGIIAPNGHGATHQAQRPRPALGLRLSPGLIGAMAVLLVTLVALLGAGAWLFAGPSNAQAATLMDIQGQVEIAAANGELRAAADGALVRSGERVRTGPASQATLVFYEGSRTTVGPNADLTLSRVDGDRGKVLQVVLTQAAGKSSHSVVPLQGQNGQFMVFTPSGAASVHGTNFSAAVGPQGTSRFAVDTGKVLVSNHASQVYLDAGQAVAFTADEALEEPAYQFTLQGELTEKGETVWSVEGNAFTVTAETVITGDPQVGQTVLVEGRILEGAETGEWVADSVELLAEGEFAGSFTGVLGTIGGEGEPWLIGGHEVLVNAETDVAEGISVGDPLRVRFLVQEDGSWLALQIELLEETPGEPTPTPTATPDPAAAPVLAFEPDTLASEVCEGDASLTGRLANTAAETDDTAANVTLGYQITQGAEHVDSTALVDANWAAIAAGDDEFFGVHVDLDEASWSAAPAGTQVEVRVFVAEETNNPAAHTSFLTVTITNNCAATPTETATGEGSPTPTETGTVTETPVASETPVGTGTPSATPEPSGTPEPVETEQPIDDADAVCTGANPHPTGQRLASEFGVDYEAIMGWFCQHHLGFGEIEKGYSWSLQYGVAAEEIFEMRLSGMGWGNIRKALQGQADDSIEPGESPEPDDTQEPDESSEPEESQEPDESGGDSGDICAGNGTHAQIQNLADEFGVPAEEIEGWYCQGWGFGDIQQAYQISLESGAPVTEVFAMRSSGMGWGQIRKELLSGTGNGNGNGNGNDGSDSGNSGNGNGNANGNGNDNEGGNGNGNGNGGGNGNGNGKKKDD